MGNEVRWERSQGRREQFKLTIFKSKGRLIKKLITEFVKRNGKLNY